MKELVEKIQEKYAAFATDAALQVMISHVTSIW